MPRGVVVSVMAVVFMSQAVAAHAAPPDAFTVMGWAHPASVGRVQRLIALAGKERDEGLVILADGRVRFAARVRDGWKEVVSPAPLRAGVFVHVAVTCDEGVLTLFLNAIPVASARVAGGGDRPPRLGRGGSTLRVSKSRLEDTRLLRRALDQPRIAAVAAQAGYDITPPQLVAVIPQAQAVGVETGASLQVMFDEPMAPASLTSASFELLDAQHATVDASIAYDPASRTVTLDPIGMLVAGASYTAVVHGATDDAVVTDVAGNPISETFLWTFVTAPPAVPLAAPTFAPAPDSYQAQVRVMLAAAPGASIRYTTDGSAPGPSSPIYTGPLTVGVATTVRAQAFGAGFADSAVAAAAYSIKATVPAIDPAGGTYTSARVVRITTATPAAEIRYTLDGSEPTVASARYDGPFTIDRPVTITAKALGGGLVESAVATTTLTFRAPGPTATPSHGVYLAGQEVVLGSVPGATIRYTVDGSTPNESSPIYSQPIMLAQSVTLNAIALVDGWQASEMLSVPYVVDTDVIAPSITASISPGANVNGWYAQNVSVTFSCTDADSGIASCAGPKQVFGEGRALVVTGYAQDVAGNVAMQSVTVDIDRTPPIVSVFSPRASDQLPAGVQMATIRGGVADLSGIASLTCGGVAAAVAGQAFSCDVPVADGLNLVRIVAEDLAGQMASIDATLQVGDAGPPASITISPSTLTMMAGEVRELSVKDDRGREVAGAEWANDAAGIVTLDIRDGVTSLQASAEGEATLTALYAGLSATAKVTVLAAGAEPPAGTVLWTLFESATPLRADVLPAGPSDVDDPRHAPAAFFVDEGSEWSGSRLVRTSAAAVRASAADGRELWARSFDEEATMKHVAADARGGVVIVWDQWYDEQSGVFYPERVQRIDGRTGATSWEYTPMPAAILGEAAVHPDGSVYVVEQRLFGDSDLVRISPQGAVGAWRLPPGHLTTTDTGAGLLGVDTDRPARPSHPIVNADGKVDVVTQRNFSVDTLASYLDGDRVRSRNYQKLSLKTSIDVVEVSEDGGMSVRSVALPPGDWFDFGPEDYRVMPDGAGGLLLGHREKPLVVRITADGQLLGQARLLDTGAASTYGSEYVLGDDGAHLLIHGTADSGRQHFTQTVRFDPLSLAYTGSELVGPVQSTPSYLRLQFALAGGGTFVTGPMASGSSHTTPLAGDVWGAWNNGPSAVVLTQPPRADTVWASPQGSASASNAAFRPGLGIFAKAHAVFNVGRHVSIRIVPHNQTGWPLQRPDLFRNMDERGRRFVTLGAAPPGADSGAACDGSLRLVSDANRYEDVNLPATSVERLRYQVQSEDIIIGKLLALDAQYADDLPYCFHAPPGPMYNSNSYASGLLGAAGVRKPLFPAYFPPIYPGWLKPVPSTEFGVGH